MKKVIPIYKIYDCFSPKKTIVCGRSLNKSSSLDVVRWAAMMVLKRVYER